MPSPGAAIEGASDDAGMMRVAIEPAGADAARTVPVVGPGPEVPLRPGKPPTPPVQEGASTLFAVQSLAYLIVIAMFTITFTLQPFRIPSASMEPTLMVGDFLLVDKQQPDPRHSLSPFPSSSIHRGDVVVFYYPVDPSLHLVKRVIGLPGDRLRMRGGRVFVNGSPLREPYAVYSESGEDSFRDNFPHLQTTAPDVDSRWWIEMHQLVDHGELKIPPGQYFVLGDNRNDSEDSRYWGLVPRASIVGEPFLVYFSLRDAAAESQLPRDVLRGRGGDQPQRRDWADVVAGLARWDRVLHVVR